jgi:hypothetical protein
MRYPIPVAISLLESPRRPRLLKIGENFKYVETAWPFAKVLRREGYN